MAASGSERPVMPHSQTGGLPVQSHTEESISHSFSSPQLGIPDLPPRPSSTPPNPLNSTPSSPSSPLMQPSQTMGNLDTSAISAAAISVPGQQPDNLHEDEVTSSRASRFVGNMLFSRIGRASWQSLESTARLPFYLSPWGDNTPFTLPNVRKRDVALAGVAHFGLDALGASAVTVMEKVVEHAVSATVEQTADEGMHRITGKNAKTKVQRRVGMNSLTLRIRHKLIGEDAELILQDVRATPAAEWPSCAKGWFCPYLYASGREPELARSKEFAMAQLLRPRLAADASIAPTLLASFAESDTPIVSPLNIPWEDQVSNPEVSYPRFRRMAIFITGISPYRYITSQSAWSHSRIPNEARITFHVFTHIPALVLPIKDQSPILAWSPWTVAQMLEKKPRYNIDQHATELLSFIAAVIDDEQLQRDKETAMLGWRDVVEGCLRSMLSAILNVPDAIRETSKECCELERTGIVAFRY
ncbi:hypothetical protein BX600DRAFT_459317 [Xylariales sp. PMI_506]|nr:hypothetical protein BX600DRAFT_459317 [Xylariales sp. PMI_506]